MPASDVTVPVATSITRSSVAYGESSVSEMKAI
jgi:hypothetical protein